MDDEKEGTFADIADAHIKQKGMVAVRNKDGESFIFTVETLRFLLKKAEESPLKRAMVFIPVDRKDN